MIGDNNEEPRPVADWENEAVNMNALCAQSLWEDHKLAVEEMRERQARYEESLPKEPNDAFRAIAGLLYPDAESYPTGFEEALHLIAAVEELARHSDFDVQSTRNSLAYLAEKAVEGLTATRNSLDRIGDIITAARKAEASEK